MPHAHVNGVDLHYLQEGEGDDVLLLCGLGDDLSAWDAQVGPFSQQYRVTVVDNRGVGRSSLPDGEFTVPDMAADAIALCDELGIIRTHVMGFSMGGAIAQELAITRPDLVRSLGIIGSWAYSDQLFRNFIESSIYFSGLADDDEKFLRYFLGSTYSHAVWEDGRIDGFAKAFLEHPYPQELDAFQRTGTGLVRRGGHHLPATPLASAGLADPRRATDRRARTGAPALPGGAGGVQPDGARVLGRALAGTPASRQHANAATGCPRGESVVADRATSRTSRRQQQSQPRPCQSRMWLATRGGITSAG